jgi:hypothetical protein
MRAQLLFTSDELYGDDVSAALRRCWSTRPIRRGGLEAKAHVWHGSR